ncbi:beta-1,3-galactosyltransferase 1 [Aplysia californica]|uniref:Hexosyltransferase n=1 Tax=Aplysia californica TaxID=6500 RepID=A0ABM0JPK0_APLCA|nr:beta-1,3-galactosyltransferase 1 [Aplysia californica]XP_012938065.1 beta-1,3-galactosyltransferase 1 [Aplysia californica]XP_035825694.1 beta-1,3-galactosyltransferase 1 [Aplysia californica]
MKVKWKEFLGKLGLRSQSPPGGVFVSVNVMKSMRSPPGRNYHTSRVILRVSIWTCLFLVLFFFIVYTILLAYVDDQFHPALISPPGIVYHKRLHGKLNVDDVKSGNAGARVDQSKEVLWNSSQFYNDEPMPQCKWQTLFRLLVATSVQNKDRRDRIRETWCNPKAFGFPKHSWHCIFLVGQAKSEKLKSELYKESSQHQDMLVGNYVDTYRNLTLKIIHGFNWSINFCPSAYVVKTDDDCFVNAGLLHRFLLYHNQKTIDLYVGSVVQDREKLRVVRGDQKWSVPYSDYPEKYYPPYASGIGYVMSSDVAKRLVSGSMYIKPFANEDAYVGVVLSRIGVQFTSSSRFMLSSGGLSLCNFMYVLMLHDVSVERQRELMKKALAAPEHCKHHKPVETWE